VRITSTLPFTTCHEHCLSYRQSCEVPCDYEGWILKLLLQGKESILIIIAITTIIIIRNWIWPIQSVFLMKQKDMAYAITGNYKLGWTFSSRWCSKICNASITAKYAITGSFTKTTHEYSLQSAWVDGPQQLFVQGFCPKGHLSPVLATRPGHLWLPTFWL
jgi:hypothetical protein